MSPDPPSTRKWATFQFGVNFAFKEEKAEHGQLHCRHVGDDR